VVSLVEGMPLYREGCSDDSGAVARQHLRAELEVAFAINSTRIDGTRANPRFDAGKPVTLYGIPPIEHNLPLRMRYISAQPSVLTDVLQGEPPLVIEDLVTKPTMTI
jgi:hypothetical protein